MWKEYGTDGVAITSQYTLLKSALNAMSDRAFIGRVRYGSQHLIGRTANLFRYITTKRREYAQEQEVRAFLWIPDPLALGNRHIDGEDRLHPLPLTPPNVSRGERRRVDLDSLVTSVVVSPWASAHTVEDVIHSVKSCGYKFPVRQSELSRYAEFLP